MSHASPDTAPIADKRPVTTELHGAVRVDEYSWLRDKDNAEVLAHLTAENEYTAQALAKTEALQEALFLEIKNRIQETDLSLPVRKGPWAYLSRTIEGVQYPIHLRRPRVSENDEAADHVMLDENELAEGHDFFALGTFEVSHDHSLLAWAIDTNGSELYELRIKNLTTNEALPDVLHDVAPGVVWSADNSAFVYQTLDELMRPNRIWRHVLGTDQSADELVLEESDEQFYLGASLSSTDDYVLISAGSQITSDVRILATTALNAPGALEHVVEIRPRENGIEYTVDHHKAVDGTESLLIISNHEREGFRLYQAPLTSPTFDSWVDLGLQPGTTDPYPVKLDGVEVFERFLVLFERADALERFRVVDLNDSGKQIRVRSIEHDEPIYSIWSAGNPEFRTVDYRFGYTSPITPPTVFEENLATGARVMLKQQQVLGGFTSDSYVCKRIWATADDGELIPVSLVHKHDTPLDGTAPLTLYGYGSYEVSIDPTFSTMRLSLLDRGMVFAIAHIRGGGERGRRWYLDGKFLNKRRTFTDFIAVADHLAATHVCDGDKIVARGGSAGGLLMGAVANLAPQRWKAIVAEVPFVDVVNTMLDESLPLTQIEWDEWGNPHDPSFGTYMSGYSPYDNVRSAPYPSMFVTAGLHDPRVGFWEPAKWVQRLRDRTTSNELILLKTELGAGHRGPTGRYAVWRDEAQTLAFILNSVGIHA